MRTAWIDCAAGASGDMLLGAFLSAGADLDVVNAAVAAVDPSLSVTVAQTSRHQIAALKASVRVAGELHPENFPDTPHRVPAARRAKKLGTGMGMDTGTTMPGMGMGMGTGWVLGLGLRFGGWLRGLGWLMLCGSGRWTRLPGWLGLRRLLMG